MRVAALYDVHGNLPALEAVLAEVPDDAVILVGGDVAMGPLPSETLERLRAIGDRVQWIRGNADRELTPGEEGLAPPDVTRVGARAALRGADRVPPWAARAARARRRRSRPRALLSRVTAERRRRLPRGHAGGTASRRSSRTSRRAPSSAATRTCSSLARSAAGASSTPAAWACRTRTSRARTGRCSGRESSTGAPTTTRRALAGIETPIRYFSEDRPSRSEVTEFFGTLAVGA